MNSLTIYTCLRYDYLPRAALASALLLSACSGGDGSGGTCEDPACASADGGVSDFDAAARPDAAAATKTARIQIELEPPLYQGESPRMLMSGGFVDVPDPNCVPTVVGDCIVTDCTQFDGATYAAPGRLSFSPALGGDIGFDPGPFRIFFSGDFIPWASDELITISSAGEVVPAFSLGVASPRTLDIGEGRERFGLPLPVSEPLKATWVPIAEHVLLRLRQGRDTPAGEYEVIVECRVGGAFGNGEVPAAALSKFIRSSDGGLDVTLDTFALREQATVAGDFAVSAQVLRSFGETLFYEPL